MTTGNTAFIGNPHSIWAKPSFSYFSKVEFIHILPQLNKALIA
jgi:hypothetical protein